MPDYADWPDHFPPVTHFVDERGDPKPWRILMGHPDYEAAKNHEDLDAAQRLVRHFMDTPWAKEALQKIAQDYPNAIIAPIHAVESKGKNKIPQAVAHYIGETTGIEVDDSLVQSNIVQRTGNDAIYRLAFRPSFDGQVQPGRPYILIDDVFSNGGSFSELRHYIEQRGGTVVHTAAMTTGGHGNIIALTAQTRLDLERKFGVNSLIDFCMEAGLYGGNYKALTEPEAFFLARSPSLDAARDRIAQARQERRSKILSQGVQGPQTPDRRDRIAQEEQAGSRGKERRSPDGTVTPDQDNSSLHSPEAPFDRNAHQDNQFFFDFSSSPPVHEYDDFIHKTIIKNAESQNIYAVIGKKISLAASGCPSEQGWKELYDTLATYRDKRFETFRFLFIDTNGEIADHLALTCRHPSLSPTSPVEYPDYLFFHLMDSYAAKNDYGIIICHNHPSGNPEPSSEDHEITEILKETFERRFRGHIILDHGNFSICGNDNDWIQVDGGQYGTDPLLHNSTKSFFDKTVNRPSDLTLIRAALQVDGGYKWNDTDWVPVVFSNAATIITSLHYYRKSDFTRPDARLFLINKTVKISEMSGSTRAFPITDDPDMFDVFRNLNNKIHLFTDFYAGGKTYTPSDKPGSVTNYLSRKSISIDSTFNLPGQPVYNNKNFFDAAEMTPASPSRHNDSYSESRNDLLKWGAVNTPTLHKTLVTLNTNIENLPAHKKKKITSLKKDRIRIVKKLTAIYSRLEREVFDTSSFESSIDAVFGESRIQNMRHNLVYFGHVPRVLIHAGLPHSSLYMDSTHLYTSMKNPPSIPDANLKHINYHNIPPDTMKQIPDSLQNPLLVLQSKRYPTSLVAVLDLYDKDGSPIIVPITPFRKFFIDSTELRYNKISSIYGKSDISRFLDKHRDMILYADKNRSRLFQPRERQSLRAAWDHFNSGFYEDNIHRYKNTVKRYAEKTGVMNSYFLSEPEILYGSPKNIPKENAMYDFTGNVSALSPAKYSTVVEYLEKMKDLENIKAIKKFHRSLVSIPNFAFINEFVPPPGDTPFDQYHAMMVSLHTKGLRHYRSLYPERPMPEHQYYTRLPHRQPSEEGPAASPFRFLQAALSLSNPADYESYWQKYNHFSEGSIKAVSSDHIAFFRGNNRIPSDIVDNTPLNWAKLFNRANSQGVAVNTIIPHPKEVYDQGVELLHEAFTTLNNNLSRDYHAHDFSRGDGNQTASAPPPVSNTIVQRKLEIFVQDAYSPGTEVPQFAELTGNTFISYEGFRFARTENANQTIILQKEGKEAAVSATLYNRIISNTVSFLNEERITPEIIEKYEEAIGADMHKTRVNTAANYWHNYRVLCREQASNPSEAMEIAKSIIREMPYEEQEKFKAHIKSYEKTSRPPETYNERILRFYHESVKDMPISNSIYSRNSMPGINRTAEVIEKKGASIDPLLKIKIGDSLTLNVKLDDLLTDKKKTLNAKNLVLVSASNDLNKVVLVDKENRSKYVFAKDEFVNRVRKLEKKQRNLSKKERTHETIGY